MFSFYELCRANLNVALAGVADPAARALWSALLWGESGAAWSTGVSNVFRELGLIHVLVLSGSQVGSLALVHRLLLGLLWRALGVSRVSWGAWVGEASTWVVLAAYVLATGAPAPLVRAFVVRLVVGERASPRGVVFAFVLHALAFPAHWGTLSFVLSWSAYLLLLATARLKLPRGVGLALLCVGCHAIVHFVRRGEGVESFEVWMLVANLLWLPVFERALFPLGSLLVWSVLVSAFLGFGWGGDGGPRRIFDSLMALHEFLAQVVLGGLEGIRYIRGI